MAPVIILEFFARSPAHREVMQLAVHDHLRILPEVFSPTKAESAAFLARLIDGVAPFDPLAEQGVRWRAHYSSVEADCCYGRVSLIEARQTSPTAESREWAERFASELMAKALCSSTLLLQGCEVRGLLGGSRFTRAILAAPDFARLAALQRADLLDVGRLGEVVESLDAGAAAERYCEGSWKALIQACRQDARYAPVLSGSA
jgi:hypothetical protein